jgi:hypothetical protein
LVPVAGAAKLIFYFRHGKMKALVLTPLHGRMKTINRWIWEN